ncbi:MAG: hypothetical protein JNM42_09355 [Propionivibrio sp.]|uniref:hypothetical protein n=1 Tax=Propionivibrio sp. TaxID=2212460 RepID=UPI001A3D8FB2|nr:hypothetical protein [Propionivibrio sp.]MBL8414628.1 hypothetical protein [Propionivibrio sp.]
MHFIDLHSALQDYHLISAGAGQHFPGQHAWELNDVLHSLPKDALATDQSQNRKH